jgi:hypothetical protein
MYAVWGPIDLLETGLRTDLAEAGVTSLVVEV